MRRKALAERALAGRRGTVDGDDHAGFQSCRACAVKPSDFP
jgi:hypothetical protein